jgi:hypothetical protein
LDVIGPVLAAVCLLTMTAVAPAEAHGPAPAALGLHGVADAPADWVRTNIGLAVARPGGAYSYVCPGMWDTQERFPPVAQLPDGRAVVAHAGVAFIIAADGCGRDMQSLPDAGSTVAVVALADAVYVVTREAASSSLWRIDGEAAPAKVDHFDILLDSAVVDGASLHLAGARPHAEIIDWAGEDAPVERPNWDASFIALRGGGRFARLSTDAGVVLLERGQPAWREVARAVTSIHGPVRLGQEGGLGEGWLMTVDGVIHQRAGSEGDFSPIREARWTCLQRIGDRVFACADFGLSEVAADLSLMPIFALDELVGVDCPDAETHTTCDGQWLHFGAEAGLVRGPPAPEPEAIPEPVAPARADDDCALDPSAPTSPGQGGVAVLLLVLALRRRIAKMRPTACLISRL